MDIEKHKHIFAELHEHIKQKADKSLSDLVEYAHKIECFLQTTFVSNNEAVNDRNPKQLNSLIQPVQNYLHDFVEIVEHLTLWLELQIPSYSDSEDFRIVVQNEILDDIASMKAQCINYMGRFVEYREQRAQANKDLFKQPTLDDNYHLISNLDHQFHRNLKLMLTELKSYILRICNLLTKNKDLLERQSLHRQHINNYF